MHTSYEQLSALLITEIGDVRMHNGVLARHWALGLRFLPGLPILSLPVAFGNCVSCAAVDRLYSVSRLTPRCDQCRRPVYVMRLAFHALRCMDAWDRGAAEAAVGRLADLVVLVVRGPTICTNDILHAVVECSGLSLLEMVESPEPVN